MLVTSLLSEVLDAVALSLSPLEEVGSFGLTSWATLTSWDPRLSAHSSSWSGLVWLTRAWMAHVFCCFPSLLFLVFSEPRPKRVGGGLGQLRTLCTVSIFQCNIAGIFCRQGDLICWLGLLWSCSGGGGRRSCDWQGVAKLTYVV